MGSASLNFKFHSPKEYKPDWPFRHRLCLIEAQEELGFALFRSLLANGSVTAYVYTLITDSDGVIQPSMWPPSFAEPVKQVTIPSLVLLEDGPAQRFGEFCVSKETDLHTFVRDSMHYHASNPCFITPTPLPDEAVLWLSQAKTEGDFANSLAITLNSCCRKHEMPPWYYHAQYHTGAASASRIVFMCEKFESLHSLLRCGKTLGFEIACMWIPDMMESLTIDQD